jgi:diguanylate cyclase (GGDEF)-like protein
MENGKGSHQILARRRWYQRPLTWAFAQLILLIGIITLISDFSLRRIEDEFLQHTLKQVEKLRLLDEMVHHSRQRSVLLRDLVLAQDAFEQDEIIQRHIALATRYVVARNTLASLDLDSNERQLLDTIIDANNRGYALQQKIIELATAGEQMQAQQLIREQLNPNREQIYPAMMQMQELLVASSNAAEHHAEHMAHRTRYILLWLFIGALLTGIGIAWLAYRMERRQSERLAWQATHDPMTGMYNRFHADRLLAELIQDVHDGHGEHVMLYLDIDRFNVINNSSGPSAGDEILRQFSRLLDEQFDDQAIMARVGGDQFTILLRNCDMATANNAARRLQTQLASRRFDWSDQNYRITVSISVVPVNQSTQSIETLWSNAYLTCESIKEKGGNQIAVMSEHDLETIGRREDIDWTSRIRRALAENRLILYKQDIRAFSNGVSHSEILLRYQDENGDVIPAAQFIPAAERYNMITEIDRYVIRKALHHIASKPNKYCYSINLSGKSLGSKTVLDEIIEQVDRLDIDTDRICFEITETAAIHNHTAAIKFMNILHGIGCRFFLDDFGTGLSSFGYLRKLPLDYVKIDGHFVSNLEHDPANHAIIEAINTIAHGFGMKTIAEGVENQVQLEILSAIGVDLVQGFLIERPVPLQAA